MVIKFNRNKVELKELVRSSAEETLNGLLEQEAQQLTNAAKVMHEKSCYSAL